MSITLCISRIACIGFLVLGFALQSQANSYAVIINTTNNYSLNDIAQAKKDIRLYYLKNQKQWPSGKKVKPYGFLSTDTAQIAFNQHVLEMSASQLTQHWLNKKQTTGESPPKALKSDRAAIMLVSKREGAFGIIKHNQANPLPNTVKMLFKF